MLLGVIICLISKRYVYHLLKRPSGSKRFCRIFLVGEFFLFWNRGGRFCLAGIARAREGRDGGGTPRDISWLIDFGFAGKAENIDDLRLLINLKNIISNLS